MVGPLVQERPGGVEQRATPAGWGIGGGGGGVGKSETSGILTFKSWSRAIMVGLAYTSPACLRVPTIYHLSTSNVQLLQHAYLGTYLYVSRT